MVLPRAGNSVVLHSLNLFVGMDSVMQTMNHLNLVPRIVNAPPIVLVETVVQTAVDKFVEHVQLDNTVMFPNVHFLVLLNAMANNVDLMDVTRVEVVELVPLALVVMLLECVFLIVFLPVQESNVVPMDVVESVRFVLLV